MSRIYGKIENHGFLYCLHTILSNHVRFILLNMLLYYLIRYSYLILATSSSVHMSCPVICAFYYPSIVY